MRPAATLRRVADQTRASLDVNAAPGRVTAVVADFEHYPEWVDSMKSAEVLTVKAGRAHAVRMILDHPLVKDEYVVAYDCMPIPVSWHLIEGRLLKALNGLKRRVEN